ncbi:hypothetical protein FGIG_06954 [Fasciola gigantica]|uniref:Uncharacterized protein n=1 Tax=Fasciola gigantica TaxID=46835 RepID=A0A504YCY1_FASGI|nr:hypothetical protein FGIG_06954 [Fasciola gigantica]
MTDSTRNSRSPTSSSNRFENLICQIRLLSQSILRNVQLDPVLVHSVTHGHVMFTQAKSVAIVVKKLRELIQLTHMVTNHLVRYQHIVERLLHDFRRDIQSSESCRILREKRVTQRSLDNVQDVFLAEHNVMRHLKCIMDKQLHRINSVNQVLTNLRGNLSYLIDQHMSLLDDVLRTRRLLHSSTNDARLESKLANYLNEAYPNEWNPNILLKNIETAHDQANRVRMDLVDLLDRLPRVVRDTQNTLYHSLIGNSVNILQDSVKATLTELSQRKAENRCRGVECRLRAQDPNNSEALKSVRDKSYELAKSKSQLHQVHTRLNRDMQTELQLLRLRRRENNKRIFPCAIVYPLCNSSFPSLTSRT